MTRTHDTTGTMTTPAPSAAYAYVVAQQQAMDQIDMIRVYLTQHAAMACAEDHGIDWGHVGEMTRLVAALKEVAL